MKQIKVGDILKESSGYNCTFVTFYKVIDVKNGFAKFYSIEKEVTEYDPKTGNGKASAVDVEQKPSNQVIRRKIKNTSSFRIGNNLENEEYVKVDDYASAYIWDGKPTYFNHYD